MTHRSRSGFPVAIALVSALTLCACGGKVEEPSYLQSPSSTDSGLTDSDVKADAKDAKADVKDATAECSPKNCFELGADCGLAPDGCSNVLNCGGCPSGLTCGATSPNKCGKASAEVCNDGVDNDGDGKTDCNDTDCAASCTGQEICDGKDNNGNGVVDEGPACIDSVEPCPVGAISLCDCYGGVHRYCRSDGTWGPCLVDNITDSQGNQENCVPATVTSQAQCNAPAVCDFGQCIDYSGTQWAQGPECLHHTDCPAGRLCELGYCIVDYYTPKCQ